MSNNDVNNLLPMMPNEGPPLPRALGVTWGGGSTALATTKAAPIIIKATRTATPAQTVVQPASPQSLSEAELRKLVKGHPWATKAELLDIWQSQQRQIEQKKQYKAEQKKIHEQQMAAISTHAAVEALSGYRPLYVPARK